MGKLSKHDFIEIAEAIGKVQGPDTLKVAFALIPFLRSCNPAFNPTTFKEAILKARARHEEKEALYQTTMLAKYPGREE